jgi:lipid II:glycine glycyltransferase (peptidoglycan interpeptide bridge formation enzyme)
LLLSLVWTTFREAGLAHIVSASHDGVPLAALLVIVSGDEMVGFAGGQGRAGLPTGAGKLVQWRAIERARELGLRRYNMWGTATGSLAHYKDGFGAREESYVGTRALAISPIPDRLVRVAWSAERAARRARRIMGNVSVRSTRDAAEPEAEHAARDA